MQNTVIKSDLKNFISLWAAEIPRTVQVCWMLFNEDWAAVRKQSQSSRFLVVFTPGSKILQSGPLTKYLSGSQRFFEFTGVIAVTTGNKTYPLSDMQYFPLI